MVVVRDAVGHRNCCPTLASMASKAVQAKMQRHYKRVFFEISVLSYMSQEVEAISDGVSWSKWNGIWVAVGAVITAISL